MRSLNVLLKIKGERDLVFRNEIEAEAYVMHVLMPVVERRGIAGIMMGAHAFATDLPVNAKMICEHGAWSYAIIH